MASRGTGGAAKKGAAARKRVADRTTSDSVVEEYAESVIVESATIVPVDQVKGLSAKDLDEDITRVVTATNPAVPSGLVIYNFHDRAYKAVPETADQHVSVHLAVTGRVLHVGSEDEVDQSTWEKLYRTSVEERRRDRLRAAQAEGKELTQADLEDELQRNQFNFTERAAQCYTAPLKTRVVSTTPPERSTRGGMMTQWSLYDAYVEEHGRLVAAAASEKASGASRAAGAAAGSRSDADGGAASSALAAAGAGVAASVDPMHSPAMSRALRVMERLLSHNAEDEIYADYKYWEDASDAYRDALGTCLPLWRFEDARSRKKHVTGVAWNPHYHDMFAVCYGSYEYMKQTSGGLISIYTLKNVAHPEYTFNIESGVLCMDWNPLHPSLLALGCYDGGVRIMDVSRKEHKPVFASDNKSGKHADPVWGITWAPTAAAAGAAAGGDAAGAAAASGGERDQLSFYSVSSDGFVALWTTSKSELTMEPVMALPLVSAKAAAKTAAAAAAAATASTAGAAAIGDGTSAAAVDAVSGIDETAGTADDTGTSGGLAGGCCIALSPFNPGVFLVGTEEGLIHRCSLDYSGQYTGTYAGHSMAVYAVRWNEFHPRVFLSCSADWTVKMWDETFPSPLLSFDLGTSVGDISWAPYSSTVFAAVTDEGKVNVYDLHANKHEQLCEQKIVRKARCTHVTFSSYAPLLLVGDSAGGVVSLKLSPNLRKITPIPTPIAKKGETAPAPPSREEIEIRKMDRLLALSDAKITIVTPIPGQDTDKKAAAGDAAAGAAAAAGGGDAAAAAE